MGGLKDIGCNLPPGFRFCPNDEELVCHYLYNKLMIRPNNLQQQHQPSTLVDIDLHTCEPWQLPEVAKLNPNEWYFFSYRDRKYATGYRTNRATTSGYWKATGKDRTVVDSATNQVVGMRKTLVFYFNRAPQGMKTGWVMHEFRLETPHLPPKEDWVLCRVFHKGKGGDHSICDKDPMTRIQLSADVTCEGLTFIPGQHTITSQLSKPSSPPNRNLLQFSREKMNMMNDYWVDYNKEMLSSNNTNDELSFLWDMNVEEEIKGCLF